MKKSLLLIPTIATAVVTPMMTLSGCVVETGGGGDTPEPTVETFVVTLFAGEGTFDGGTHQIILSNIKPGTILQDVEGYQTAIDESFSGWLNNGNEFYPNQPINSNMLLTAKYSGAVTYKAYVVCPDGKEITLTNTEVKAWETFNTNVCYASGNITPQNISVYVGGKKFAPYMEQVDPHTVSIELTGGLTYDDVAIVVNFPSDVFHSYICNDPDDGLEMIDNTIPDDDSNVGTFKASTEINNVWSLKRVIIGGVDVDVKNFQLEIDPLDVKKATIKVLNGVSVNGDVLIWFEPNVTHVEWKTDDPLPSVPQLPVGTPPAEALEKFNEFVLEDKANICNDFINAINSPLVNANDGMSEIKFDVYDISYDQEKGWFNISWDFVITQTGDLSFVYNLQGRNLKAYVKSTSVFDFLSWTNELDEQPLRDFLTADESWSIVGYINNPLISHQINLNSSYIAGLSDIDWHNQWMTISNDYGAACAEHLIYYLQNITPL